MNDFKSGKSFKYFLTDYQDVLMENREGKYDA